MFHLAGGARRVRLSNNNKSSLGASIEEGMRLFPAVAFAALCSCYNTTTSTTPSFVDAFATTTTRGNAIFRLSGRRPTEITIHVPFRAAAKRQQQQRTRSVRFFSEKKKEAEQEEEDLYLVAASTIRDVGSDSAAAAESSTSSFATSYHAPVMWKECIEALTSCERKAQDDRQEVDAAADGGADGTATAATDRPQKRQPRVFIDGTLGGGGHSQALLQALQPGDVVFGCDVDPDALAVASLRLSQYHTCNVFCNNGGNRNGTAAQQQQQQQLPLFVPVQCNFGDLTSNLLLEHLRASTKCGDNDDTEQCYSAIVKQLFQENDGRLLVDGILLDLGVSSYQIDTAERGFAFMKDGPLDMRMNGVTAGRPRLGIGGMAVTAADLCNELDAPELRRIFSVYGDEPRARAIAESIVQRRPLRTTMDLQEAVAAVTPQFARKGRRMGRMATLARVFQSLRIAVNQEDVVLERALTNMAPELLRPGGRLVVLSYHSMEDRATKRVMRDGTVSKREANHNNEQKDMYGNYIGAPKPFRAVGKAQKATDAEVELNARARSATLRVVERQES